MRASYACGCAVSGLSTPARCPLHHQDMLESGPDTVSHGRACPIFMAPLCACPFDSAVPACEPSGGTSRAPLGDAG